MEKDPLVSVDLSELLGFGQIASVSGIEGAGEDGSFMPRGAVQNRDAGGAALNPSRLLSKVGNGGGEAPTPIA